MRVTVLGAGSWGTTVASVLCRRDHEVLLWARDPDVAAEVDRRRRNEAYLPGIRLPARLRATADLERAGRHAELLVVGVPTGAFRETLENLRPHLAPWLPVVSLSKGLERGTHLRMTEVIKQVLPGRPAPRLVSADMVAHMKAGSVIVDLAAEAGGNVEGTRLDEVTVTQSISPARSFAFTSSASSGAAAIVSYAVTTSTV